jgi:hypothetical protein
MSEGKIKTNFGDLDRAMQGGIPANKIVIFMAKKPSKTKSKLYEVLRDKHKG